MGLDDAMTGSAAYRCGWRVAAYKPFSRWAVVPESGHSLGIPFYTRRGAQSCLDEIRRELPWDKALLLRKRLFFQVEVVSG